ncbi:MAG: hypothetical protein IJN40_05735 [Clostridia bacterium]|nr:hypothetical protein [Clostridia bacterium]
MKKSSFVALVLGTVSMCFFAFGMCMALVSEWNTMKPGIVAGLIGIILGVVTIAIWRKMENKPAIKINGKIVLKAIVALIGALTLGVGMCFCMVWNNIIIGSVIGIIGIIILLMLIPLIKGIK